MGSAFDRLIVAATAVQVRVFGETVTYRQGAVEDVAVTVIWSQAGDAQAGVYATARVQAADLPEGFAKGDQVVRGGKTYLVSGFVDAAGNGVEWPAVDDSGAVALALRLDA